MTSKFKPLVLYATDFYKLSSLLVQRVLLSKPVGNLASYKQKTKQLLLDQSRTPNTAAVKLLYWDKEFGLLQYYGVQEYARRWWESRSSTASNSISSSTSSQAIGGTAVKSESVARVAFMITSEQRQKLSVNLGYTQQDIRSFKPIEALLLIENNIKKTTDDDATYNFRDRLKELVDENEKLISKEAPSSSVSSNIEKDRKSEKSKTITPEEAEHAHVKADVAMALLLAEKGDDSKMEDLTVKDTEIADDAPNNDNAEVSSAVALVNEDDAPKQETISSTKSEAKHDTATKSSQPVAVKVTPNDSTELHMKPDVAAAYISSHVQKEETGSGVSDVNDTDEETEDGDGPCWYEVVMGSMDAKEKGKEDDVVVALFATKKEALECVDIKKRLASGSDKRFSVRRRWNV